MSFKEPGHQDSIAGLPPEYSGENGVTSPADKELVRSKIAALKSQIPSLKVAEQFLFLAEEVRNHDGSKKQLRAIMELWKDRAKALPPSDLAAHLNENIARKRIGKVIRTAIREVTEGLRHDLITSCATLKRAHPYKNLCEYFQNNPTPAS